MGSEPGLEGFDESAGLVPDPAWKQDRLHEVWFPGDSVNMAIGQGDLQLTPLQMANMVAMVANQGVVYRPHVLKETRNPVTGGKVKVPKRRYPVFKAGRTLKEAVKK